MDFALDNELWARTFLETWQKMQANGYDNLADGPKSSWIGYSMLPDAGMCNMFISNREWKYFICVPFLVFELISLLNIAVRAPLVC